MLIRGLDILFSAVAIIILSPLLIFICFLLLLTGEGKVFYLQSRIGLKREEFNLIKFATMLEDSPNIGSGELTEKDDPRVLPVGRFLRASKINELPQLLNILKGQMSFVGPRPQTKKYFSLYADDVKAALYNIKPGLTGIASLVFRNEEELFGIVQNPITFDEQILVPYKGKLEVWFSKNKSIFLYLKIILLTILAVISPNKDIANLFFKNLPKRPSEIDIMFRKHK
jgi:lipopolysaccharide/colanic/teichoic acid biosynthesis glycosyltransferase